MQIPPQSLRNAKTKPSSCFRTNWHRKSQDRQPINRTMFYLFLLKKTNKEKNNKKHKPPLLLRFFNFNSPRLLSMASLGNKNLYWILENRELSRNTGFMSSLPSPLSRQLLLPRPASNYLIHSQHCTGFNARRSFHKVILPVSILPGQFFVTSANWIIPQKDQMTM